MRIRSVLLAACIAISPTAAIGAAVDDVNAGLAAY